MWRFPEKVLRIAWVRIEHLDGESTSPLKPPHNSSVQAKPLNRGDSSTYIVLHNYTLFRVVFTTVESKARKEFFPLKITHPHIVRYLRADKLISVLYMYGHGKWVEKKEETIFSTIVVIEEARNKELVYLECSYFRLIHKVLHEVYNTAKHLGGSTHFLFSIQMWETFYDQYWL